MAKYRLTYFDGRGLAECTRYLLTLGGADWEDNRMSITFAPDGNHVRPEFNALKEAGALPFGQVPILEVEGKTLAQSKAIERYLARELGFLPANSLDIAFIDSFTEAITDFRTDFYKATYWAKAEDKEVQLKNFVDSLVPKHLALLEHNVVESENLHLGDVTLYATWESLVNGAKVSPETLDAYPKLKARWTKVHNNEKIAKYLAERKETPF